MILAGMTIFMIGAVTSMLAPSLNVLGLGTGVAGVMARTMPRDLYAGVALRQANSLLNMGLLVSPLLAPVIGALVMLLCWLPLSRQPESESITVTG